MQKKKIAILFYSITNKNLSLFLNFILIIKIIFILFDFVLIFFSIFDETSSY